MNRRNNGSCQWKSCRYEVGAVDGTAVGASVCIVVGGEVGAVVGVIDGNLNLIPFKVYLLHHVH
jgi:uncharacterized membrane protein